MLENVNSGSWIILFKSLKILVFIDQFSCLFNNNNVIYFDSFGIEHILKEIKKFIKMKNIETNIFRVQAYDSIMCGYFYTGFINYMLKGKALTEYTNLFSTNNFKKNDDIILNYFMSNI